MKKILKFSSKTCLPCRMLTKAIHDSGLTDQITEIDLDDNQDTFMQYNVRGVPTMVIVEDDKEVKRHVGNLTAPELKAFLS